MSCSEKRESGREKDANTAEPHREMAGGSGIRTSEDEDESQPGKDDIEEDCAAFVSSTKVVPARAAATDCPGCSVEGTAVLSFRGLKMDAVSCSGETCTVVVTIRAVFNPGSGEKFAGGLTAWIPPEQRTAYLSGHTPSGDQTYRVRMTYKRRDGAWRPIEFDRASVE